MIRVKTNVLNSSDLALFAEGNDRNVPNVKDQVRALRLAIGWTQEQLADRAGLERTYVVNAESGRNQLTTDMMRAGMAKGFGLSRDDFAAFLAGSFDVEEAMRRRAGSMAAEQRWENLEAEIAAEPGRWDPQVVHDARSHVFADGRDQPREIWRMLLDGFQRTIESAEKLSRMAGELDAEAKAKRASLKRRRKK